MVCAATLYHTISCITFCFLPNTLTLHLGFHFNFPNLCGCLHKLAIRCNYIIRWICLIHHFRNFVFLVAPFHFYSELFLITRIFFFAYLLIFRSFLCWPLLDKSIILPSQLVNCKLYVSITTWDGKEIYRKYEHYGARENNCKVRDLVLAQHHPSQSWKAGYDSEGSEVIHKNGFR